jgi:Fic family protein
MSWNWQQQDWPDFQWDASLLEQAERRFLVGGGMLLGATVHLEEEERSQLTIELMSSEALHTSEIEGETLDRASIQSSIRRKLGLPADEESASLAEQAVSEMTVDALLTFDQALTQQGLCFWQSLVTKGRNDLTDIGRFRTHAEPMQIVSARLEKPKVYFEAPPSAQVPAEMSRFIGWFNGAAVGGGEKPLPALTRAGIAHLYFESIHPFEDGNGRVGRAVAEKALSQGIGQPTFVSLSSTILARRRSYYGALAASSTSNEITDWLLWFAGMVLEAQRRTLTECLFILDKARMLDRLRGSLNGRQEKALLRMFREGSCGFVGGLSASNYAAITGAPHATTTRDLADLVSKKALRKVGELRHTRYHLAVLERQTPHMTVNKQGEIIEE